MPVRGSANGRLGRDIMRIVHTSFSWVCPTTSAKNSTLKVRTPTLRERPGPLARNPVGRPTPGLRNFSVGRSPIQALTALRRLTGARQVPSVRSCGWVYDRNPPRSRMMCELATHHETGESRDRGDLRRLRPLRGLPAEAASLLSRTGFGEIDQSRPVREYRGICVSATLPGPGEWRSPTSSGTS